MPPAPAVILGLNAQIPAELEAGVGAGDVVEGVPVQAADLHVLHRLRLDRHVGGLRPSYRDQTRGGTEEKTFHHLHLNLHLLTGRDRSPRALLTLEGPLAPLTVRSFRGPRCPLGTGLTGRSDMGMPPSVAGSTLSVRQATKKRHFEQPGMQFPAGCCTNNTWRMGAATAVFARRWGSGRSPTVLLQATEF